MKKILLAASVLAMAANAQAAAVHFSLEPGAQSFSVAGLIPSNLTLTSATLSVDIGPAGFWYAPPQLGAYQLQSEVLGPDSCPAGGQYMFCEVLTKTYVREQASSVTPMAQSARLQVGGNVSEGDNRDAPLQLVQKIAGPSQPDSSTSQGEEVLFGWTYHPDGSMTPSYIYHTTVSNYATQDYQYVYDKPHLTLQLAFDAATLATLNQQQLFNYSLLGSLVLDPVSAQLQYEGAVTSVPEPSGALLLLAGLPLLGWAARRRRA